MVLRCHQFAVFLHQLGDGRGCASLGEYKGGMAFCMIYHMKGALAQRLTLVVVMGAPVTAILQIREYLASEGSRGGSVVPSSRALSAL